MRSNSTSDYRSLRTADKETQTKLMQTLSVWWNVCVGGFDNSPCVGRDWKFWYKQNKFGKTNE